MFHMKPASSSRLHFPVAHLIAQVKNLRGFFDGPVLFNLKCNSESLPFKFCFQHIS